MSTGNETEEEFGLHRLRKPLFSQSIPWQPQWVRDSSVRPLVLRVNVLREKGKGAVGDTVKADFPGTSRLACELRLESETGASMSSLQSPIPTRFHLELSSSPSPPEKRQKPSSSCHVAAIQSAKGNKASEESTGGLPDSNPPNSNMKPCTGLQEDIKEGILRKRQRGGSGSSPRTNDVSKRRGENNEGGEEVQTKTQNIGGESGQRVFHEMTKSMPTGSMGNKDQSCGSSGKTMSRDHKRKPRNEGEVVSMRRVIPEAAVGLSVTAAEATAVMAMAAELSNGGDGSLVSSTSVTEIAVKLRRARHELGLDEYTMEKEEPDWMQVDDPDWANGLDDEAMAEVYRDVGLQVEKNLTETAETEPYQMPPGTLGQTGFENHTALRCEFTMGADRCHLQDNAVPCYVQANQKTEIDINADVPEVPCDKKVLDKKMVLETGKGRNNTSLEAREKRETGDLEVGGTQGSNDSYVPQSKSEFEDKNEFENEDNGAWEDCPTQSFDKGDSYLVEGNRDKCREAVEQEDVVEALKTTNIKDSNDQRARGQEEALAAACNEKPQENTGFGPLNTNSEKAEEVTGGTTLNKVNVNTHMKTKGRGDGRLVKDHLAEVEEEMVAELHVTRGSDTCNFTGGDATEEQLPQLRQLNGTGTCEQVARPYPLAKEQPNADIGWKGNVEGTHGGQVHLQARNDQGKRQESVFVDKEKHGGNIAEDEVDIETNSVEECWNLDTSKKANLVEHSCQAQTVRAMSAQALKSGTRCSGERQPTVASLSSARQVVGKCEGGKDGVHLNHILTTHEKGEDDSHCREGLAQKSSMKQTDKASPLLPSADSSHSPARKQQTPVPTAAANVIIKRTVHSSLRSLSTNQPPTKAREPVICLGVPVKEAAVAAWRAHTESYLFGRVRSQKGREHKGSDSAEAVLGKRKLVDGTDEIARKAEGQGKLKGKGKGIIVENAPARAGEPKSAEREKHAERKDIPREENGLEERARQTEVCGKDAAEQVIGEIGSKRIRLNKNSEELKRTTPREEEARWKTSEMNQKRVNYCCCSQNKVQNEAQKMFRKEDHIVEEESDAIDDDGEEEEDVTIHVKRSGRGRNRRVILTQSASDEQDRTVNQSDNDAKTPKERRSPRQMEREYAKDLFRGKYFLLTGFKGKEMDVLKDTVDSHGGEVLQDVPLHVSVDRGHGKDPHRNGESSRKFPSAENVVVVAPGQMRTLKFLYSCAIGAPAVTPRWMYASISAKSCLPISDYQILCSQSEDVDGELERQPWMLKGFHVILHGSTAFKSKLGLLIQHAGGMVLSNTQFLRNSDMPRGSTIVVVGEVGSVLPLAIQKTAEWKGALVKDQEWLVQVILHGKTPPVEAPVVRKRAKRHLHMGRNQGGQEGVEGREREKGGASRKSRTQTREAKKKGGGSEFPPPRKGTEKRDVPKSDKRGKLQKGAKGHTNPGGGVSRGGMGEKEGTGKENGSKDKCERRRDRAAMDEGVGEGHGNEEDSLSSKQTNTETENLWEFVGKPYPSMQAAVRAASKERGRSEGEGRGEGEAIGAANRRGKMGAYPPAKRGNRMRPVYYSSARKGELEVHVGDYVELRPPTQDQRPYIAKIEALRISDTKETSSSNDAPGSKSCQVALCRWFYRAEETPFSCLMHNPQYVYLSDHIDDEVPLGSILRTVNVSVRLPQFMKSPIKNKSEVQRTQRKTNISKSQCSKQGESNEDNGLSSQDFVCCFWYDHCEESLHGLK